MRLRVGKSNLTCRATNSLAYCTGGSHEKAVRPQEKNTGAASSDFANGIWRARQWPLARMVWAKDCLENGG